jgi:hypothetical protein
MLQQEEELLEKNITNPWVVTGLIAFIVISVGLTYLLCLKKDPVDGDDYKRFKNPKDSTVVYQQMQEKQSNQYVPLRHNDKNDSTRNLRKSAITNIEEVPMV